MGNYFRHRQTPSMNLPAAKCCGDRVLIYKLELDEKGENKLIVVFTQGVQK